MSKKFGVFGLIGLITLSLGRYPAQSAVPSLEEKIGQMLLLGFRGTKINAEHDMVRILRDIRPGGIVLFDFDVPSGTYPRNIINPRQTRELVLSLQSFSPIPLLIAVDAEGGRVNRLKPEYGFLDIPSAAKAGKMKAENIRDIYRRLAEQLAGLGISLNLAPVVDLNLNPANPIIGALDRSFADDPEIVVKYARLFISAHHEFKVCTAIKHFPGHGSSRGDSHKGLTDITHTYNHEESIPFRSLITAGLADAVMTAHVVHKQVDPDHPATLSTRFIRDILRDEWGYSGVVISDDLHMGAVLDHYSLPVAAVQAVQAGCDILALSNNGPRYDEKAAYKARDALLKAVKKGKISEESLDRSYQRIMQLKKQAGLIKRNTPR
jgi:beta-N-acetylhexosaminidase